MFLYSKKIAFHYALDHWPVGGVSQLSPSLSQSSPPRMLPSRSPWTQSLHILKTALKALWQPAFKAPYLALMLIREELSRANTLTMKFTWMVQECLHYVPSIFSESKVVTKHRSHQTYSVPTTKYHNLDLTISLNTFSWPNNQQILCGLHFISYFPINTEYTTRAGN